MGGVISRSTGLESQASVVPTQAGSILTRRSIQPTSRSRAVTHCARWQGRCLDATLAFPRGGGSSHGSGIGGRRDGLNQAGCASKAPVCRTLPHRDSRKCSITCFHVGLSLQ